MSNKVYLTLKGNYFNNNFGATDNELTLKLFYRKQGESSWGDPIDITSYATISENTFSITNQLIGSNFSYEDSYEFRVVAQDKVVTDDSVSSNRIVTEGIALFDIGKNDVLFKGIKLLDYIDSKIKMNVDLMYPVGSIYLSTNSINPSEYFGGEWESWGSGRVPVGIDTNDTNFNTVEKTGGNKVFNGIHLTSYLADGSTQYGFPNIGNYANRTIVASGDISGSVHRGETPINISLLQPYITCYMWKRTA